MKRNKTIETASRDDNLIKHKQRIAFHEAGHAAAIFLNNRAKHLPMVPFQIILHDISAKSVRYRLHSHKVHDYAAKVEGGRLTELPSSASNFIIVNKSTDRFNIRIGTANNTITAFEADVINLLVGPLAEAKHVADSDGELFNPHLVNLAALKNYGGSSDLDLVHNYLQRFGFSKHEQKHKLDELFMAASAFIGSRKNWTAITKLANYILDSHKHIISYEEVVTLLGKPAGLTRNLTAFAQSSGRR